MKNADVFALSLCVSLAGLALAAPAMADTWVTDSLSGCEVWLPEKEKNESVSWSGHCVNGKANGAGVLVVFDGTRVVGRYEGSMNDGRAQGDIVAGGIGEL